MRLLLGEHWWLGACCKGLWGGMLLQRDRSFRLCRLSGPLIRQEGLLQALQGMMCSTVDQRGTSALSPRLHVGSAG